MKRILLYIAALALALLGGRGTDIGSLRPVELVRLTEQGGILVLDTDTGDRGWGLSIDQVVEKLKETTSGEIYLDTADFLLLEEGTEVYLSDLRHYLKEKTAVAYAAGGIDLKEAVSYLRIHEPSGSMKEGKRPREKLILEAGKMILKKFQEN